MTSPVTGEIGPPRAATSASLTAKAEHMLVARVAADCRARCAALLNCHPPGQAIKL